MMTLRQAAGDQDAISRKPTALKEPTVTPLSLEEVLHLLDMQTAQEEQWQLERLRKWVERLVETRGKDYVLDNRIDILNQWEQHISGKFKTCL
jgi:hypothetical protein